jgi:putative aldouronate transport system permease protein
MIKTRTKSGWIFDIFNYFLLVGLSLITLYPLVYVLFASVSNPTKLLMNKSSILYKPLGFQLDVYRQVLKNQMVRTGFTNSIFYVVAGTCISLFFTLVGGYLLSRTGYYFKKFFLIIILITMYFGGGLIPGYLLIKRLGMLDTIWALLIPSAISTYNMLIVRTAFSSIPEALIESATIDGANDIIVLYKICIPLSIPTISVIGLFYAVGKWNAWFNALIYISSRGLFPLQLVLREILISSSQEYLAEHGSGFENLALMQLTKYVTIVIATLPVFMLYPFIQRYFVKGIMLGSIKS